MRMGLIFVHETESNGINYTLPDFQYLLALGEKKLAHLAHHLLFYVFHNQEVPGVGYHKQHE